MRMGENVSMSQRMDMLWGVGMSVGCEVQVAGGEQQEEKFFH